MFKTVDSTACASGGIQNRPRSPPTRSNPCLIIIRLRRKVKKTSPQNKSHWYCNVCVLHEHFSPLSLQREYNQGYDPWLPREDWDKFDPHLVSEGAFAAAMIFRYVWPFVITRPVFRPSASGYCDVRPVRRHDPTSTRDVVADLPSGTARSAPGRSSRRVGRNPVSGIALPVRSRRRLSSPRVHAIDHRAAVEPGPH